MTTSFQGSRDADGHIFRWGRLNESAGIAEATGMRRFPHYAFMFVLRGEGIFRAPQKTEALRPGSAVLVVPDSAHHYAPVPGSYWDEAYLIFDGPIFRLWSQLGWYSACCEVFQCSEVPETLQRFSQLLSEDCPPQSLLRRFANVARFTEPREESVKGREGSAWLQRAQAMLVSNLEDPLSLPEVAAQLGESYTSFRRRFRTLAGVSPHRTRLLARLNLASDLLSFSSLSLRAIAERCGFSDEFHLSHAFAAEFGQPPSVYRQGARTANQPTRP